MRKKGFTLVELIVVIVIVAVLAAALVASLVGYIVKARDSNLITECSTVVKAAQSVAVEYHSRNDKLTLSDKNEVLLLAGVPEGSNITVIVIDDNANIQKLVYISSDGDAVTYENHRYIIGTGESFGDGDTMQKIAQALKKAAGGRVDSGASVDLNSNTQKVIEAMKAENIDLDELGAATWCYVPSNNTGDKLYWSPVDISTIPPDSVIPVMCYNFNSKNYTVRFAKTGIDSESKPGYTYYKFAAPEYEQYKPSTNTTDKQTYEKMLADYDNACLVHPIP